MFSFNLIIAYFNYPMIIKEEIKRRIDNLWPKKRVYKREKENFYYNKIKKLLKKKKASLIAHYYVDPIIQRLAE